jgi:hypothetical protein
MRVGQRRRCAFRAAILFLVTLLTGAVASAQDKRILLLYDEDKTLPGLAILDQSSLRSTFSAGLGTSVQFFSESMNLSQFTDEHYEKVLREHYSKKYRDKKLDLVVGVMGPALGFLLRHGDAVFPGVPVIFCGADGRHRGHHASRSRHRASREARVRADARRRSRAAARDSSRCRDRGDFSIRPAPGGTGPARVESVRRPCFVRILHRAVDGRSPVAPRTSPPGWTDTALGQLQRELSTSQVSVAFSHENVPATLSRRHAVPVSRRPGGGEQRGQAQ